MRYAGLKHTGLRHIKRLATGILAGFMLFSMMQTSNSGHTAKAADTDASIRYEVHCQTYGWGLGEKKDGATAGTQGQAKRLEAIKITVDSSLSGSVEYETHCQTYGWLSTVRDGAESGTHGEAKRLEAIRIRLTGQLAEVYDVVYRVHRQTYGWTDWVKNGAECGTTGQAKRLEAIQIKLVKKNSPEDTSITYTTHCQTYGWLAESAEGEISGTTGQAKRLEAIKIDVPDANCAGGITYRVHRQTYGWTDWVGNNMEAGTTGQAKRLEAIQIKLTGDLAEQYDVYYRVYCQTYGWLSWTANGEKAGTEGLAKRLESIQIVLVERGDSAPGDTTRPFIDAALAAQIQKEQEAEAARKAEEEKKANEQASSANLRSILNSAVLKPTVTNDAAIDAKVKAVLAEVTTADMDNYDKLLACFNWIRANAYYKSDSYASSWNNTSVNYVNLSDRKVVSFAHTILIGNGQQYGTCINYASAMTVFARALGFDAYRVGGETARSGGGYGEHYWCVIKIDGIWYNFDPQIADYSWVSNPLIYFGRTNSEWLSVGYKFTHGSEKAEDYITGGTYQTN